MRAELLRTFSATRQATAEVTAPPSIKECEIDIELFGKIAPKLDYIRDGFVEQAIATSSCNDTR
ncbi:hypothetical protein MYU51_011401 [Penicillium brevicompactum]